MRRFQQIFNLTSDSIVGRTTWYQLVRLYVGILELAELDGEGRCSSEAIGRRHPVFRSAARA